MSSALAPPTGFIESGRHCYPLRVYHEDTDASGVVYHANYLRWFERARSEILRLLGVDQRGAIDAGDGFYVVSDMAIRFRQPGRLGDAVVIETTCDMARAASVRMEQSALRGDDTLCTASVRVGFVGSDGRPRRQPAAWRDAFQTFVSATERLT